MCRWAIGSSFWGAGRYSSYPWLRKRFVEGVCSKAFLRSPEPFNRWTALSQLQEELLQNHLGCDRPFPSRRDYPPMLWSDSRESKQLFFFGWVKKKLHDYGQLLSKGPLIPAYCRQNHDAFYTFVRKLHSVSLILKKRVDLQPRNASEIYIGFIFRISLVLILHTSKCGIFHHICFFIFIVYMRSELLLTLFYYIVSIKLVFLTKLLWSVAFKSPFSVFGFFSHDFGMGYSQIDTRTKPFIETS